MDALVLDAVMLEEHQACRRKLLLSHDYRPLRWRPKVLFDACLRRGVVALSTGRKLRACVAEAQEQFMQSAANPGLDILKGNPYTIAKDWCAMLATILITLSRITLLALREVPAVHLSSQVSWRVLAHADESGVLHRWLTIDHWGESDLYRELHGWRTIGDIVTAGTPMTLHIVEIGQERGGRRASPWARAWRHPRMPGRPLRFRYPTTGTDGWKSVYLADTREVSPEEWVELMWQERMAEELLRHVNVNVPSEDTCSETKRQIMLEAMSVQEALTERGSTPWSVLPMSRGACDGIVPCAFQYVCYADVGTTPESTGLYQIRKTAVLGGSK